MAKLGSHRDRRVKPYRVAVSAPVHVKDVEPLEDFVEAVRAMLGSAGFEAVLGEYERHNVSRWAQVRGWIEFILKRCEEGNPPSAKQRELCNHYLFKSGGKGVRCFWNPCYIGPEADDRLIESHLKGLAWLRRRLAASKEAT